MFGKKREKPPPPDALTPRMPHVAAMLFNTPLLLAEEKLLVLEQVLAPRMGISLSDGFEARQENVNADGRERSGIQRVGGVAVIDILGTLVHRGDYLNAFSGLTSYEVIREEFDEALLDAGVHTILLHIDSPGGAVPGVFDLADHIFESRGRKRIVAVAEDQALSAAYLLGSAAEKFHLTQTGALGSIGVITARLDRSKANQEAGTLITHIYAGARKADLRPDKKMDGPERDAIQAMVDEVYGKFVDAVARNRALGADAVRGTEAGIFIGGRAVEAGLADSVVRLEKVVDGIVSENQLGQSQGSKGINNAGGNSMDGQAGKENGKAAGAPGASGTAPAAEVPPTPPAGQSAPAAAASQTGEQGASAASGAQVIDLAAARGEGEKITRQKLEALRELCMVAGVEKPEAVAMDFFAKGVDVEQARKELLTARAQKDAAAQVAGRTVSESEARGVKSKLDLACEQLIKESQAQAGVLR